jgi:hypothetical protein
MRTRIVAAGAVAAAVLVAAGCGGSSSSGPTAPTISAARVFKLTGFTPSGPVAAGKPVHVSFTIQQPSGKPLTSYKRGAGPHTGIHLIFVRDDLGAIVHHHPKVGADGKLADTVVFPTPGRYRVVVDAYPDLPNLANFQLFDSVRVKGAPPKTPLPPFSPKLTVDGDRFTMTGAPKLRALQPAFLTVTVRNPQGKAATFTPWFGALAHAIFFHAGSLDYFHTHVCSPGASGCASAIGGARVVGKSSTPGKLTVGVLLPESGTWRLFLQTKVDGKIVTAPFTLKVR